jgi:hypothetical protein
MLNLVSCYGAVFLVADPVAFVPVACVFVVWVFALVHFAHVGDADSFHCVFAHFLFTSLGVVWISIVWWVPPSLFWLVWSVSMRLFNVMMVVLSGIGFVSFVFVCSGM